MIGTKIDSNGNYPDPGTNNGILICIYGTGNHPKNTIATTKPSSGGKG